MRLHDPWALGLLVAHGLGKGHDHAEILTERPADKAPDRLKRRVVVVQFAQQLMGLLAVSRDCFPLELSKQRRQKVAEACRAHAIPLVELETVVEHESDVAPALREIGQKGVNALAIYLGNFGPEGPATLLAQKFGGPVMLAAAAKETGNDLYNGRGDAYCGMLSASYNVGLRRLRVHIPRYPVGSPDEVAVMLREFFPVARVALGLKNLKIFSFGPRPYDFLTCHAPIQPLFDLGVEIVENSELDMLDLFHGEQGDPRIKEIARDMAVELGRGNSYPNLLEPLAQRVRERSVRQEEEPHEGAGGRRLSRYTR